MQKDNFFLLDNEILLQEIKKKKKRSGNKVKVLNSFLSALVFSPEIKIWHKELGR